MLIRETVAVASDAIRANRLRSLLTMLGIIIGIAAVITMVALGEGAQRVVKERLQAMGTNVLTVRPGQEFFGGLDRGDARLTAEDADALLAQPEHIAAAAPQMQQRHQVEHGGANATLQIVGVWPAYFSIENFSLAAGRFFTASEEKGRRRLALLGALTGERLNAPTADLLGKTIRLRGIPFEVIGVLQEKGSQGFQNPDEGIYIPLSTAQFRVFGEDRVGSISVQAVSPEALDPALAEIDLVLRRAHRIRPGEPSDFTVRNQTSLLTTFQETSETFSFLLAGIALVSLLVGGIGIMNIMLVSVTERTREIGVRKALGARRRDILLQFVIEALVLCLVGGALGVGLGVGASIALQRLAGWNAAVAPESIALAFLFSAAVGIFFGLWPAVRASRLEPIVALRYE